nr:unnamed protein product [Callosobruchus analis]
MCSYIAQLKAIFMLQMASPTEVGVLGQPLERRAENPQDNEILERIETLAKSHLPEEWIIGKWFITTKKIY